eukprot:CAMPEP_0202742094 /NCGR_PEP_ID=MMETSP1388-20130828/4782_1 /ASSEMBLY_ACC=CAM_ASM_000864 /TAXON_ID=37098 /ORGANISM="Isochrysis sp, Strain CCMP1244" /LENGTH=65 /DNA_ID=CAMNT_0049408983 /DNA_START=181 /DNA_END=374 /DNA_ORIENTATION=+
MLSLLAITVSSSRSSPPSGSRHSTASSQTRDDPTPTMLALRAVNDGGRKLRRYDGDTAAARVRVA